MQKGYSIFSLVCSFLIGGLRFSTQLFVVAAAATGDGSGTAILCRTDWNGDTETAIPEIWVNDGYCDCPFDGKDEPDTDACSGSLSWAGVNSIKSDPATTEPKYVCPQQPKLILPLSRLNDGICDCCDGSDEESGANPCIDNCFEVLKVQRERQAKLQNDFLVGSKKRERDLARFEKLRTAKVAEASDMSQKMAAIKAEIEDIEGTLIAGLEEAYVLSRVTTMKDYVVGHPMAIDLLSGLKLEELEALLVHVCQIAGEISKSEKRDNGESTCLALRVAALDLGLTWDEKENYDDGTIDTTFHNATDTEILQIIFENAAETEGLPPLRWRKTPPTKNGRRRLDEVDDDYIPYDDDKYMMHDDEYRDYMDVDESEEDFVSSSRDKPVFGKQVEFIDQIRLSLFSASRAAFLKGSKEVLDAIDNFMSTDGGNNDDEESSVSDNSESGDDDTNENDGSGKVTIDPFTYTALRMNFGEKCDIIERGLQWGASAKFLLGASQFSSRREILERLLIGTIFYGQLGAIHVWQILQSILPEYTVLSKEFLLDTERICASPWAGNCPPQSVYRDFGDVGDSDTAGRIEYPPSFLLKVASKFCDEESARIAKRGDIACHQNGSNINIEALLSNPSREGHSDFGYEMPLKRNKDTDPFQTLFDPISNLALDIQGLHTLEDRRDAKETELGNLRNNVDALWKEIGGRNGHALGRNGEFHSIANQCFEIVAGKYTYELCMFGKAFQKDVGSKTNLGRFEDFEYSSEGKETRILKWDNGAKCWNGPKRSATVHMTCGPDHKLMSANEPDTCRYVFEMESYLACDEVYKISMEL